MKRLPKELWKYFWDVRAEDVDLQANAAYVVARLMDYGDTAANQWMRAYYGDKELIRVLGSRRGISRKSAMYWARILDYSTQEVKCLQMPYRRIPYGV